MKISNVYEPSAAWHGTGERARLSEGHQGARAGQSVLIFIRPFREVF